MGDMMGTTKLNEYAAGFGLGQPTGIELGEETGFLIVMPSSSFMACTARPKAASTWAWKSMSIVSATVPHTDYAAHILGRTGKFESREERDKLNEPYNAAREAGEGRAPPAPAGPPGW